MTSVTALTAARFLLPSLSSKDSKASSAAVHSKVSSLRKPESSRALTARKTPSSSHLSRPVATLFQRVTSAVLALRACSTNTGTPICKSALQASHRSSPPVSDPTSRPHKRQQRFVQSRRRRAAFDLRSAFLKPRARLKGLGPFSSKRLKLPRRLPAGRTTTRSSSKVTLRCKVEGGAIGATSPVASEKPQVG